jgi:hypothetical protein
MYFALVSFHTLQINRDDLPNHIFARLEKLWAAFAVTAPAGNEGQWRASINAMSETELCEHAHEISEIYDAVCRYQEPFDERE